MTSVAGGWEARASGRSQREALVRVALAALAPGSQFLAHVGSFPPACHRACAVLLENVRVHLPDILAFLRWTLPALVDVFPNFPQRLLIVSAAKDMWRGGL